MGNYSSTGWATFLQAVIEAGFAVVGTWPLRTEMANRMIASGTNALANSVVLVCRKKELAAEVITRAEFIRALKRELPPAIAELQAANIAPADMAQSAIGPGMGVFSRYKAVLESDDSPMSVKASLQLINRELDEYLGGIQGEFDADTRFAITWFEQNGMAKGDYGTANNIAQARGISVESVKHAGIVESAAGKVRILRRDELMPDWEPSADSHLTIWECCQYLIRTLEAQGEYDAAMLLKKIGPEKADAVTRRIARAIFLGTAPTWQQQNKGLDDKQINLGVVQPGERPAIFGDALRRLANQAKFMHADMGRYWYSMSASLNRVAADRAGQLEDALVLMRIDEKLKKYINGIADRGHFDAVQVAPASSAEVPDEAGGVRAVVLGVAHTHTGRDTSQAMAEAKDILMQRGNVPRVYRNMLVFLAAETRQLDHLKDAVRSGIAWGEIVRDTDRLNLTQSDSALAKAKAAEANETMKTRLREAWCYLLYPVQESAQAEVEWTSGKIPAQDGVLSRASKKLVSDEGLLPELGPTRLDRDLQKYIWNGKGHLSLKDLWEYLNRYLYLPRLKGQSVLVKAVQAAVGSMIPGPFAYAERWDEKTQAYLGLVIDKAPNAPVVIDSDSVIVKAAVAEANRPTSGPLPDTGGGGNGPRPGPPPVGGGGGGTSGGSAERQPTRFFGTVMISSERPARDIHQIVEAIVEQLTTISGSQVSLKLEIDAEVPSGLDRAKVRTLVENANTLGFLDKVIG